KGTASLPPMVAAISRAVVGHDALDGDAVGGEPGERALEKRHRAFLALVAQHLAKGQARGIINADVEVFPASAAPPVAGIAGDAVPNRLDTAELLDIDMDQLAWPLALVAHRRRFGFERRQPAQPEAAQDLADRRNRHAELPRDRRTAQPLSPQPLDLDNPLGRGAVSAAPWRRAAISQCRRTATAIAGQPVVGAAGGQSGGLRCLRHRPALLCDALDQQESTPRRQPRILVEVHPGGLPIKPVSLATHSLTGFPRMNNLRSSY